VDRQAHYQEEKKVPKKVGEGLDRKPQREVIIYLLWALFGVAILVAITAGRLDYIGFVLLVPSLVWLGRRAWRLVQGIRSQNWLPTEGAIVAAHVWQYRFIKYASRVSAPYLQYRYEVAGKVYQGGPVVFGQTGPPEEVLNPYPPGASITVFYDPHDPAQSRLRRGNRAWSYLGLLTPLALLAVSITMICV
jgi:hypothetical protein